MLTALIQAVVTNAKADTSYQMSTEHNSVLLIVLLDNLAIRELESVNLALRIVSNALVHKIALSAMLALL